MVTKLTYGSGLGEGLSSLGSALGEALKARTKNAFMEDLLKESPSTKTKDYTNDAEFRKNFNDMIAEKEQTLGQPIAPEEKENLWQSHLQKTLDQQPSQLDQKRSQVNYLNTKAMQAAHKGYTAEASWAKSRATDLKSEILRDEAKLGKVRKELKDRLPDVWALLSSEEQVKYEKHAKDLVARGVPIEDATLSVNKLIKGASPDQKSFGEKQQAAKEKFGSLPGKAMDYLLEKSGRGSFAKGVMSTEAGKAQAILSGIPYPEYKKSVELPADASLWEKVKFEMGSLLGKTPSMLAGGAAGGSVGGPIGAGAGFFAVPAMLDTALEEYMKYKNSGGEASFEGFMKSVDKVGGVGLYEGAKGVLFGTLTKALPLIKSSSPAAKKFFEEKSLPAVKEFLAKGSIETAGLVGSEAIAKREMPTLQEVGSTFGQVFAFNLFHAMPGIKNKVSELMSKKDIPPSEMNNLASKVKAKFEEAGGSTEGLKAGKKEDVSLLDRTITDMTKEMTPEAKKTQETAFTTEMQDISPEALERREVERKAYAEKIAKEPVEEYTNKPKMTKLEEGFFKQKKSTEAGISSLKDQISRYQSELDRMENTKASKQRTQSKNILEKLVEQRKSDLQKAETELKRINENIKRAAPKRKSLTEIEREKVIADREKNLVQHMKELQEISENPKGETAKQWAERFKKDQKYVEITKENMKRGELPSPEHIGENIKILNRYFDEYQALNKLVHERLKTAKGKEKLNLQRLQKNIKKNAEINRAKKQLFERYRTVKEAVKKPFIAKQLQEMGVNLGRHERVIFEAKKVLGDIETKTKQAWEKYQKNPTRENLIDAAEKNGMNGEKTAETVANLEEAITTDNEKVSEEKTKESLKNADEATKGKTSKERKDFWYSGAGIAQALARKLGIDPDRRLIRALAFSLDLGPYMTMAGIIRILRKEYKVQKIKAMKRSNNYRGIEEMHRKHINNGHSQASWNKLLK